MNTNPESNNFIEELEQLLTKYGIHKELKMPVEIVANLLDATINLYYSIQYEIDECERNQNEELLKQNAAASDAAMDEILDNMPEVNPNGW